MNIRKPFSAMRRYISIVMSVYVLLLLSAAAFSQTTISTGSIQGRLPIPRERWSAAPGLPSEIGIPVRQQKLRPVRLARLPRAR